MRAFVIAMECEAECVRPILKSDDMLYLSGIGKVNAAMATAKAICEGADEIVNVGLCGGFGNEVERGGIYGAERAVEWDFDLSELNHTDVGVLNEYDTPYLECDKRDGFEKFDWFGGWRTLASGDAFTNADSNANLVRDKFGAALRDMEGAAIAHVCKRMNVRPPLLVKCVSDVHGGANMIEQYCNFRDECLERLAKAMRSWACE